jgi:ABC-type multidrug transport system fused ATPase/permease subunit
MSIGLYIDIKDFKQYYELLKNTIIKDDKIIDIYLHNLYENNSKSESNDKLKTDEPIKYKYLSMLCNRILFQHTQIGAFFKFDPKMPRLFRIMLIFVGLFNSLFLTALLYGYTSYGSMSLTESFVLSIITAVLNYPSLILLNILMNYAGLHEFKWRYPLLIDELDRRHKYEDEISMYKSKELDDIDIKKIKKIIIEDIHFSLFNSIYGYWNELFSIIRCKRKKENKYHNNNEKDNNKKDVEVVEEREKGSIEKAYFFATKDYVVPIKQPSYYSLLPFHTTSGGFVFFISIGWLIWCLNYLLLFASVHQSSVSNNILTSFGFTELQTVFITQPISLMIIIFIGFISNKIKKWCGFHNKIQLESIYYYSDPYRKQYSTELSTRFAFEIFVNIPSQISYSINYLPNKIKNLGYASVESVVEYIEKDDIHFTKKSHKFNKKELAIINLYERMKNKKLVIEKKVNFQNEIIIDEEIHDEIHEEIPNIVSETVQNEIKFKHISDPKFERLHYFKKIQPWKP